MSDLLDWVYDDFVNDFSPENRATTITTVVVGTLLIWLALALWDCLAFTTECRADEKVVRTWRVRVIVGTTALTVTVTWVTARFRRSLSPRNPDATFTAEEPRE